MIKQIVFAISPFLFVLVVGLTMCIMALAVAMVAPHKATDFLLMGLAITGTANLWTRTVLWIILQPSHIGKG